MEEKRTTSLGVIFCEDPEYGTKILLNDEFRNLSYRIKLVGFEDKQSEWLAHHALHEYMMSGVVGLMNFFGKDNVRHR